MSSGLEKLPRLSGSEELYTPMYSYVVECGTV